MPKKTALARYAAKRNFSITPEPAEGGKSVAGALQFVVQKHWASRLHYDFRLELEGTMKSWAVPKGPSYDTQDKRMAIHVEDHPISYNQFEGQIPEKQYGAGKVIIWDRGVWTPLEDPVAGYAKGMLKFTLKGHKLHGAWALIHIRSKQSKQDAWLLIKEKDEFVRPAAEFSVVDEFPDSVVGLPEIKASASKGKAKAKAKTATTGRAKARESSMPEGAVRAAAPKELKPLLATLADAPPANPDDWVYEVKFDGYRVLAKVEPKGVRLITRNGHDWTAKLKHLAKALQSMKLKPGWLDGEIVMLKEGGSTSFQDLQNAFESERTADIVYYLFDLPYYNGYDLTQVPLVERRALLESLLVDPPPAVRFSAAFEADPAELVTSACKLGLEGIIGKRRDSRYSSRRSPDWIKLKCGHRQEFVIGGWTDPKGSRTGLGSLLLGVHNDKGELVYAGKVGSGFNDESLRAIGAKLKKLAASESPFSARVPEARGAHWVKPRLLAEVTFSEWTSGNHLRHPVFHALRTDKPAKAIVREEPVAALGPDVEEPESTIPARVRVSNPERVVDPTTGITKIQIVRYYALIGELMMPHLRGRPVSLVKAPQGIKRATFFQKHVEKAQMEGVEQLAQRLDPDHPPYLEVAEPIGLVTAAQMNVIELHTWNATKENIDRPDRMTFDLDPGEGVEWREMQQAAELVRGFLEKLELPAFLKTSGGKGLHVVTPLKPQYDWDTVKAFSQAIVEQMSEALPERFTAKSGPKNRVGRIFIDYLRNGFGATTACAWTARARPGLGISVPLAWSELKKLKSSDQWTIVNAHSRLAVGNEPWKDYAKAAKGLTAAMKMLQFAAPKPKKP
jgi:bifunctional non-homologous end joining protein LigD